MQNVLNALISSGIPYTVIISYVFMGYLLPHLGQLSPPSEPDTVTIFGDGTNKGTIPCLSNPLHASSGGLYPLAYKKMFFFLADILVHICFRPRFALSLHCVDRTDRSSKQSLLYPAM